MVHDRIGKRIKSRRLPKVKRWRNSDWHGKVPTEYCMGKVVRSLDEAQAIADARLKEEGIKLRVYRCNYGDHYHLTSKI